MDACCTCTQLLSSKPPSYYDKESESALPSDRRLECCARIICGKCIHVGPFTHSPPLPCPSDIIAQHNKRFADYCPFCQISSVPSPLPQHLRNPPAYTSVASTSSAASKTEPPETALPPPYTPSKTWQAEEQKGLVQDILHFLDHSRDTVLSLSLRYGVPATALRRANNLNSDHLLVGRRTVLIPGEHCQGGVSLSPRPVEGEEEELRKAKIRRFMTSCKVSDYDEAVLYLEQSAYHLGHAVEAYLDDERWAAQHPPDIHGTHHKAKRAPKSWRGL